MFEFKLHKIRLDFSCPLTLFLSRNMFIYGGLATTC